MSEDKARSQLHIQAYAGNEGDPIRVNFTLGVDAETPEELLDAASDLLRGLKERGYTSGIPGTENISGADYRVADSVIRSRWTTKNGKEANRLDFFRDGDETKGAYLYLNTGDDYAYIERATGVSVSEMPILNEYPSIKRQNGKPHELEVRLPKQMRIVRAPELDDEGNQKYFNEHPLYTFAYFVGYPRQDIESGPGSNGQHEDTVITSTTWRTEIVKPNQSIDKLFDHVFSAVLEQYHDIMQDTELTNNFDPGVRPSEMLENLGYGKTWVKKALKELGYSSFIKGHRVVQAEQVSQLFRINFLLQYGADYQDPDGEAASGLRMESDEIFSAAEAYLTEEKTASVRP